MQGVLTFAGVNGWRTGPAIVGIVLALCASIVVRELAPYENPSTNLLANIAQLQLLATCACVPARCLFTRHLTRARVASSADMVAYMLLTELLYASDGKLIQKFLESRKHASSSRFRTAGCWPVCFK